MTKEELLKKYEEWVLKMSAYDMALAIIGVDKQTVADASIDGNANVGTKDICSLTAEMSKPHSKLLAFNKIFYELNKKYGLQTANEWLENE